MKFYSLCQLCSKAEKNQNHCFQLSQLQVQSLLPSNNYSVLPTYKGSNYPHYKTTAFAFGSNKWRTQIPDSDVRDIKFQVNLKFFVSALED